MCRQRAKSEPSRGLHGVLRGTHMRSCASALRGAHSRAQPSRLSRVHGHDILKILMRHPQLGHPRAHACGQLKVLRQFSQ